VTYTSEQLSPLSDEEINVIAARIEGEYVTPPHGFDLEQVGGVLHYYDVIRVLHPCHPDYCGDDALAFRLMIDNDINLITFGDDMRLAFSDKTYPDGSHYDHKDENPNRAIAICFILMNQGEG